MLKERAKHQASRARENFPAILVALLVLADGLLGSIATALSAMLSPSPGAVSSATVVAFGCTAALGLIVGLHRRRVLVDQPCLLARCICVAAAVGVVAALACSFGAGLATSTLVGGVTTCTAFTGLVVLRWWARHRLGEDATVVPFVVAGGHSVFEAVEDAFTGTRSPRLVAIGRITDDAGDPNEGSVLGSSKDAGEVCRELGVTEILAESSTALQTAGTDVRVRRVDHALLEEVQRLPPSLVTTAFVAELGENIRSARVYSFLKRLVDIVGAALGLLVWSPLLPFLYVAVKLESKGPFIYRQPRVGYEGKQFTIYKIRTMTSGTCGERWASPNDSRITRIGGILRRTRLDEFPQLWNVLRGDMSIVGPRPEQPRIADEIAKSVPQFPLRTRITPGLTGWAQICQGYVASVEDSADKLSYDLFYMRKRCLALDADIMLRTIFVMVGRIGSR